MADNAKDGFGAGADLDQVMVIDKALTDALTALQRQKSPGTVIFFDLVGSTGYRHRYQAEAGLQKAHLHNMTVSRCVTAAGGKVIKWIGDAVMGFFPGKDDEKHAVRAVRSALLAIDQLKQVSKSEILRRIARPAVHGRGFESDHDIHTKIAICSGLFHYFDLLAWTEAAPPAAGAAPAARDALIDPMGGSVDLASRMTHLARPDVIVMDEKTFWGHTPGGAGDEPKAPIPGVTEADRGVVRWRRLHLPQVRDTVYVPRVTGFFVDPTGLVLSRLIQASDGEMTAAELTALVEEERQEDNLRKSPAVFAMKAVPCNIPGFDEPVPVIALTAAPQAAPLKHSYHSWPADEIAAAVAEAERSFRRGDVAAARGQFQRVLEIDGRNCHANLRLAMLARADRNTDEALDLLTQAKESNPDCTLAWAVAGMVHLDDFVHNTGQVDARESLQRAVTGFTRAKKLAREAFQGVLEQYSTGLLAVTCFLHRRDEDKLKLGKSLLDELRGWPPKNVTALRLRELASIFLAIALNDPGEQPRLGAQLEALRTNLAEDRKPPAGLSEAVPHDHVLNLDDLDDLASIAVCRAAVSRPRAGLQPRA